MIKVWYGNEHWITFESTKSALDVYVETKSRGFLECENYKIIIPFERIIMIEKIR
jgi:hypothetical protein